jgi:hypothetical protein
VRKRWTDLIDAAQESDLAQKHGFAKNYPLANHICEALWGYRQRTDASKPRTARCQQKHFLVILKNRAARGRTEKWSYKMTFDDAINLGLGGLCRIDANEDPAALLAASNKALTLIRGDRGGAPRDYATDFWLRSLIVIYESGTGRKAAAPISVSSKGGDQLVGPFSRFVKEACSIAGIKFGADRSRSKLRRLIREVHALRAKYRGGSGPVSSVEPKAHNSRHHSADTRMPCKNLLM